MIFCCKWRGQSPMCLIILLTSGQFPTNKSSLCALWISIFGVFLYKVKPRKLLLTTLNSVLSKTIAKYNSSVHDKHIKFSTCTLLTLEILICWGPLMLSTPHASSSISLGTYAIWSQSIKVTHLVIGNKRYSVYPPGWLLYLWEVYFCSTSCDLPSLGQLNNLHTYSFMTPAQTHGFQ